MPINVHPTEYRARGRASDKRAGGILMSFTCCTMAGELGITLVPASLPPGCPKFSNRPNYDGGIVLC